MAKMIFVNLPVSDLARATAFYQAIGAVKNEQFCDDTASCMVFSETIHAMLLTHDKFRQFTPKKIADAKTSSEVLICLSADSREAVDDMVGKAQARAAGRSLPEAGLRLHVWPQFRGSRRPHLGSDVDGCRRSDAVRHGRRLIVTVHLEFPMSKISPACGSTARPRRPRISTFRCCRICRTSSDVDGRGKAGTVLVVEFTLAGQRSWR